MVIALAALIAISAAAGLVSYLLIRRVRALHTALRASEGRAREIGEFLARFSSGIQGEDGVAGAMRGAARHVAEQIEAGAVVIYEVQDGRLTPVGAWGDYTEGGGDALAEHLKSEDLVTGKGFAGEIALKRAPELVADAACDDRFSRHSGALNSVMGGAASARRRLRLCRHARGPSGERRPLSRALSQPRRRGRRCRRRRRRGPCGSGIPQPLVRLVSLKIFFL